MLRPGWLRPLRWIVRGAAVVIIVLAAQQWFRMPGPVAATTGGEALRAEISVPLAGGRRFAVYLGPTPMSEAGRAVAAAAMPASSQPVQAAPAELPRPSNAAVASRMCRLGDGVIAEASFNAGSAGLVSAYGLDDVAAVGAARDGASDYALPLLQRVRAQGALAGLRVGAEPTTQHLRQLPSLLASGDGAGAYAMGVAHGAIDLLIVGGGDFAGELNPWYHSLNAGMRTQLIGAMACNDIVGDAVVTAGDAGLTRPAASIRRSFTQHVNYVSDGRSRLLDFTVNGHSPGPEYGAEVRLTRPGVVNVRMSLAAELPAAQPGTAAPAGWNIENARLGNSRTVSMDVVVNGKAAASQLVPADGVSRTFAVDVAISRSAWVAIRLPGAGHSNPVYVLVDNQPVRASRSSVEWNLQAVTRAWEAASTGWEGKQAALPTAAYEYAYAVYNRILQETSEP